MKKNYFLFFVFIFLIYNFQAQELIAFSSQSNANCSGVVYSNTNVSGTGICRSSNVGYVPNSTYTTDDWTTNNYYDASKYLEWSITPVSGYELELTSLRVRYESIEGAFITDGPDNVRIMVNYGTGFNTIYDDTNTNSATTKVAGLTSIPITTNTVTFRLYAFNSSGSGGDLEILPITSNRGVQIFGSVTSTSCNDLFISEYVEGSSNNKFIEIYNPTTSTINLSGYSLQIYYNGSSSPGATIWLSGSISPYDVFIIENSSETLGVNADLSTGALTFNGDDAVTLRNSGTIIDVIGQIGFDPGSEWAGVACTQGTQDGTLIRNSAVQLGDTDGSNAFNPDTEWTCYGIDNVSNLGSHISDCQGPTPDIQLVDNIGTNQSCGYSIDFGSVVTDGSYSDVTVDIENVGTDDLNISNLVVSGDYSFVSPPTTPFTIAAGSSITLIIRFTPSYDGIRNGVVNIISNDTYESPCSINLTGTGYTLVPDIDVERNTGSSIPNWSLPNNGYNTVFATTSVGSSSAPKTFHVSSEGTADLDLTSITSSNPSEFSISLDPSPATITPGNEVDFEITFSPSGPGNRTATITILNNDTYENPYIFYVEGNGECTAGTLTLSPDNGPVNTIVNVTTSSSNFGGSTTATVNGITATVNIISSTELEVTIPTGAETGSLDITDDLGCVSSELFTVIDEQISSCEGSSGTAPTDLFISEVTDHGSGSHSYVEIYNGTGSTVDLTDYEIRLHNNGAATATNTIALTGSVVDNDVFVLAFGSSDATNPYATHGYDQSSSVSGINEDDNIRLYYAPTNTWVDLWGDTSGSVFTVSSNNYTYRRKNSGITAPSTTWDANDWDSFSPVDYSDVGTYDFSTGVPPTVTGISSSTTACNEVTISVSASEGFSGSNPLAYYWYAYDPANAGLGWQAISNGGIYTTSIASPDLIISDTGSVLDFQFYCQVRENDASCYDASNAIKVTLSGATWDGTNWIWNDGTATDTMPNITTNVIINGNYDTSAGGIETSFSACSLVVNNGFDLDITNGTYIEISNDITANGNITVFPQGSVVQIDDLATVTGSGTMTVQKETTLLNTQYDYTYWSSPVVGETIENLFGLVPSYGKHYFEAANFVDTLDEIDNTNTFDPGPDDLDDDGNDWQPASGTMQAGVGYAAMPSVGGPAFPVAQQFAFVGPFNNGVVSQPLVNNSGGVYNDWNFIGNPYPSAISTVTFFSVNSGITDAIYLWNQATPPNATVSGSDGQNFSASDYAVISASSVNTAGGDLSLIPNDYIPSGQGFFIEAQTTGPIVFNNSMRVTGNNNQFFRSNETNKEVLWLNLTSDNGVANQLAVAHIEGATDLNDGTFYDVKRNMSSPVHAALYSTITGEDTEFVIQGKNYSSLDLDEVITLGFKTTIESPTTYTISIAQFVGAFYTDNDIYLKDNLLNITHNIKNSDYNFTSTTGVFNNRFEVVFVTEALSINDNVISANDITISELQNGEVRFSTSKKVTITNVEILDVLGRQIYNLKGNNSTETYNLSQLSKAAYIAKISLSNGQVISKKAIKQR